MFETIIINEEKMDLYGVGAKIIQVVSHDQVEIRTDLGDTLLVNKNEILTVPRKLSANELNIVFNNIKSKKHPLSSIQ